MATRTRKTQEHGVVGRLAERGEEATTRLLDVLGRNVRLTDALARAASAKGRLDSASKTALSQVGLAPADDVKDLRRQVERLEKRLAKLESGGSAGRSAKRSETKKTPSTAKRTTRKRGATTKGGSPSAGRAIGGGPGRSSSPGGGTAR
jgi:hypothetical protein